MTNEQNKRVVAAIIETKAMLNKEIKYKKELQNNKQIEFLNYHIAKLEGMLSASWEALTA